MVEELKGGNGQIGLWEEINKFFLGGGCDNLRYDCLEILWFIRRISSVFSRYTQHAMFRTCINFYLVCEFEYVYTHL